MLNPIIIPRPITSTKHKRINRGSLSLLILLSCLYFITSPDVNAQAANSGCVHASEPTNNTPARIALPQGKSTVTLNCQLTRASVLSFSSQALTSVALVPQHSQGITPIQTTGYAYLLAPGNTQLTLELDVIIPFNLKLSFEPEEDFHHRKSIHAAVMYGFLGFCFALALYVLAIGHSMRSAYFYAYAIYISSSALFFAAQEHIFSLFFPAPTLIHHYHFASILAATSLLSGQIFVASLLDFERILPLWYARFIRLTARAIFATAIFPLIVQTQWAQNTNVLMGLGSLVLLVSILLGIIVTVKKKVDCAGLVLLSSLVMVVAMVMRILLTDYSEFLTRYALIIAMMIDAFILSVAVSAKVRSMYTDKINATLNANLDPLCNIYNKRGWYESAQTLVAKCNRRGGVLAIMYIDVDKFKAINDTYGHNIGDQTLIFIANLLTHQSAEEDVIGRLGGDEFVTLARFNHQQDAHVAIERLKDKLAHMHVDFNDNQILFSASVGHKIMNPPIDDLDGALCQSDADMYHEKALRQEAALS